MLLEKKFCETYGLDANGNYKIEIVNPAELIVPERLDLIAKIKYLEHKHNNFKMDFSEDIYREHIRAFTLGTFIETGKEKEKNTYELYVKIFNDIDNSVAQVGFNPNISVVPVGKNNAILDGAHRTAACFYHNVPIAIVRLPHLEARNGAEHFKRQGLSENTLDYLITEYCKVTTKNIYVACLWPVSKVENLQKRVRIEKILNSGSKIIYRRKINLNFNGICNLVTQIYCNDSLNQGLTPLFPGAIAKAKNVFLENSPMFMYILEGGTLQDIVKLKQRIRKMFDLEQDSIHVSDTTEESLIIINMLLNQNSVNFLNRSNMGINKSTNMMIKNFKETILRNQGNLDNFIIDSGCVLELYGLRKTSDIDFITSENEYSFMLSTDVDCHNSYIKFYNTSVDDLLYNPNNFFIYSGIKFMSLYKVREFKVNRGENKDLRDVKLIDDYLANDSSMIKYINKIIIEIKNQTLWTYYKAIRLLSTTPLYNPLRALKRYLFNHDAKY